MYIQQNIEHASHEKIQEVADIGIFQGLPKPTPELIVT